MYNQHSSLRCANGSSISVIGFSVLPITIGSKTIKLKMAVVDTIFPNVILGMGAMRKFNTIVNPSNECIELRNVENSIIERVPFVSQSSKQS